MAIFASVEQFTATLYNNATGVASSDPFLFQIYSGGSMIHNSLWQSQNEIVWTAPVAGTYRCEFFHKEWDGTEVADGELVFVCENTPPGFTYDEPTLGFDGTISGGFSGANDAGSGWLRMFADLLNADTSVVIETLQSTDEVVAGDFSWPFTPAGNYKIRYRGIDKAGNVAEATTTTVTLPETPGKVLNLTSSKTASTKTYTWQQGAGIVARYYVEAHWDGEMKRNAVISSGTAWTIEDVPRDAYVEIKVWQENLTGKGDVENGFSWSWFTPEATTVPVASLLTPTSFRATWSGGSVDSGAKKYQYRINGGDWVDSPAGGSQAFVDLTGLQQGATHVFETQVVDSYGVTSAPQSVEVITPADTQAPRSPSFLRAVFVDAAYVHVFFDVTSAAEADPGNAGFSTFELSIVPFGQNRLFMPYSSPTQGILTRNTLTGTQAAPTPGTFQNGALYEVAVRSKDLAGNVSLPTVFFYRHALDDPKRTFPMADDAQRLFPRVSKRTMPHVMSSVEATPTVTAVVGTGSQGKQIDWNWQHLPLVTSYEYSTDEGATWFDVGYVTTKRTGGGPGTAGTNVTFILRAVNPLGPGPSSAPLTRTYPSGGFG